MRYSPSHLSRRALVGAAVAIGTCPFKLMAQTGVPIIAGTYAKEGGGGLVRIEEGSGGWTMGRTVPTIRNASFGVRRDPLGLHYLVDEQTGGSLGIYARDFHRIAAFPTLGADPCHVALSPDGSHLAVANYSSGSVTLWRLDRRTGLPVGEPQSVVHKGSGPDPERQASPHAHWVGFAPGRHLLHAVDLGADAIFAHVLDPGSGAIAQTRIAYRARPGSGPRHLARHPRLPVAFLVAELANTVTILDAQADGSFRDRGTVSTLPAGFDGSSAAAHIAINRSGDRLYVSNRGHDSIAVFAIAKDGGLAPIQHIACGGHWPRMFLLLEDRREMLVANERSGTVTRLAIGGNGTLGAPSAGVSIPAVVYLSI